MQEALDMALHITKEKNTPWQNASNVIFPIISEASISFAARAYPALVRDEKVVEVQVVGNDAGQAILDKQGNPLINPQTQQTVWQVQPGLKKARAERVGEFMNYQFCEEMEEWEEDTDRMLHALPIVGNMYRKIWWDYEEERVKTDLVFPKYLIINNNATSFKRAPRLTEEKEYYPNEIIENIRCGLWLDFKFGDASEGKEKSSERVGDSSERSDNSSPHLFLEQCRRIDLDEDGYPEPYRVLVHKQTNTVVRILADYQEDGIKKNDNDEIKRIIPETYYIKYGFIPSPDGSPYDLGFGELLLHSSQMINSLINQLIDAGSLANTSHGFIGDGLKIKGGKVEVTKGTFTKVDSRGMSIKDNLVQIQHPEPSMVLFQLLGMLIESAKNLGSLKDVLSGEAMGANQPGITTLTLIEQGLTAFKSIYKRLGRSVRQEAQTVYRLDSIYLHEEEARNVLDSQIAVSRDDFNTKDLNVRPTCAPHMVSDMQRLSRASFLETYRQDPYVDGLELRKRIFDMAGVDKPEQLLKQPDPPPPDANLAYVEVEKQKVENQKLKMQADNIKIQMDNQNKQKDLQIKELQAQIKVTEAQSKIVKDQHTMATTDLQKEKLAAEIDNIDSATVKNLADAEGVEAGQQLNEYIAKKDSLNNDRG
jgi:chaperonin GroES